MTLITIYCPYKVTEYRWLWVSQPPEEMGKQEWRPLRQTCFISAVLGVAEELTLRDPTNLSLTSEGPWGNNEEAL